MARVRVRFFASPREIVGEREIPWEIRDGATARELLDALVARFPKLAPLRGHLLVSVNREFARAEDPVRDGDEVAIMPPVSGGAGTGDGERERSTEPVSGGAANGPGESERDADSTRAVSGGAPDPTLPAAGARIQPHAASLDELLREVSDPSAGAVASFVGTVRSESGGSPVVALEYEFYEGMAEAKLQALAERAVERFGLCKARVVHRAGRFAVGEPVLWVAASASHRDAAFSACRWMVEELKASVPIWKKEHVGKDGVVERARWVGAP
ncbi:MAG TPA: MoaD family protein [Candidatus Thermoplasmatota archaeon]|nr:MoaD family protein [Candidatus Thermoplasmatota archaeon]